MVGATLGSGGVGRYQGLHGLILGALESVELVTSIFTGDLITVSSTQKEYFPVQAVSAVADNTTAYPHREIRAHEDGSSSIVGKCVHTRVLTLL